MNLRSDLLLYAVIGIVAFCVFANTLGHGFVYDDNRQILMNPMIQRSELYGRALTSDVWAFKGGGSLTASNYFRPTFVGWMIANWFLFDGSASGWHLTNILLHVGVCLLLFAFLRRLGCERFIAAVIAILFAVHPVHVENVAWISGATDTLLAVFLLASLILAQVYAAGGSLIYLALSVLTYLLALGSKEVALFCVPLYWLIFQHEGSRKAIRSTIPFAVVAVGFFTLRVWVLGAIFMPVEDPTPAGTALSSVPRIFAEYLQQVFFPFWLGPSLPIRPVGDFALADFVLPLILSIVAVLALGFLAMRSFVQAFGLTLFGLTLLPVLNPSNFSTEHLAHDRYLYLPLAGILMLIVPELVRLISPSEKDPRRKMLTVGFGALAIVLAIKTVSYNSVWFSSETLWRYAVTIDPQSAHAWFNLASATPDQRESLAAYERSLSMRPTYTAFVGKSRALISLGNNEAAVGAARSAIAADPKDIMAYTLFQAYEAESYALAALGRFDEAERSLRDGRRRLPIYQAAMTEQIAVMLYSQNRKGEALEELEGARRFARDEFLPGSKMVLLRLGMLYAEMGNRDAARQALIEFLQLTEGLGAVPASDRRQAATILRQL
jgi:protein O-mannosyl-transferase